jgi:hypothetical protein
LKTGKIYGGGVFTIVDVAKAFHAILCSTIGSCLRRKGIPTPIIELTGNMYGGCRTTIRQDLTRGSKWTERKQSDPLSPLLFNTCIDPLLDEIQKKSEGVSINSENKVSFLAFADDIILLGKNGRGPDTVEYFQQLPGCSEYENL